jgi:hypothetical protein
MKLVWSCVVLLAAPAFCQRTQTPLRETGVLYDPTLQPQPVRILNAGDAAASKPATALVRLNNGKLAIMVRDGSGKMQPFFVKGLETGYWDSRRAGDDYGRVFANYKRLGANTSFFMIHWNEIEPQDGKFDFSYTDKIVEQARGNGVKIWWVLFLHCQSDHPANLRKFWVYSLDSRDGKDYAIQWLKDENGVVYDSMAKLATLPGRWEITPAYGHPKLMPRIQRMLVALARRYRDSDAVLVAQIDNEAGFGYYTPRGNGGPSNLTSDYNPVTAQIFEEWKQKTGKSDWHAFKLAINKYYWQQFTTAFHRGDPYKLTSFNFLGGNAESGDPHWIDLEGVDVTTYAEGNLDVASPMFYRAERGPKIFASMDEHYDAAYRLPILISSEIGLGGRFNPIPLFQQYVINCLERGAQGYAAYDYGSQMGADGNPNASGEAFRAFADMVDANLDVIHGGVPGSGGVKIESATAGAKVSQLNRGQVSLGILHFPSAAFHPDVDGAGAEADVRLGIKAAQTGAYSVAIYKRGKRVSETVLDLEAGVTAYVTAKQVAATDAVFVRVTRNGLGAPPPRS